jgi:hypothetical protein
MTFGNQIDHSPDQKLKNSLCWIMPFPSDEQIMKTSQELVDALQALFGKQPGFRPGQFQYIKERSPC